jgi:hypothetical protein
MPFDRKIHQYSRRGLKNKSGADIESDSDVSGGSLTSLIVEDHVIVPSTTSRWRTWRPDSDVERVGVEGVGVEGVGVEGVGVEGVGVEGVDGVEYEEYSSYETEEHNPLFPPSSPPNSGEEVEGVGVEVEAEVKVDAEADVEVNRWLEGLRLMD